MSVLSSLPGWERFLFIELVIIFLIAGVVVASIIMRNYRWPLRIRINANISGLGYGLVGKDRARVVRFGDGGEELILLKKRRKLKVGYGKRTGLREITFNVADDGLWYQVAYGDFDKTLREMGMTPTSRNVRLGMTSARKGLDEAFKPKSWAEKYAIPVMIGAILLIGIILGGSIFIFSKKQVEVAQINAQVVNDSLATQQATQETLRQLNILIGQINSGPTFQGSGLVPNG